MNADILYHLVIQSASASKALEADQPSICDSHSLHIVLAVTALEGGLCQAWRDIGRPQLALPVLSHKSVQSFQRLFDLFIGSGVGAAHVALACLPEGVAGHHGHLLLLQ
jgi:hypothetical protein